MAYAFGAGGAAWRATPVTRTMLAAKITVSTDLRFCMEDSSRRFVETHQSINASIDALIDSQPTDGENASRLNSLLVFR
jgi:hypothetical protein